MEDYLISQRKNIARSNSDLGAVTELGSKGDKMISKISEWKWIIFSFSQLPIQVKFIYSERATPFCEIFTLHLTVCTFDYSTHGQK